MEEEENHIEFEQREYIYKIIYLVRINLPSSEIIYFIMLLFKYLGLFAFSISLNNINETTGKISQLSYNYYDRINYFLKNLLITGNSLKILDRNYQEICLAGFLIMILFVITIIYCIIYMKNKYYNKTITSIVDKKIKIINNSSKFEKKLLKIVTYIFFLIVFFHQYIIEYYLFGFIGYILNYFDINDESLFSNNKNYYSNIVNHFKNLIINPIASIVINLITIILVLFFFISFMYINSTHALFLNNGIPFYGNKIYFLIKIIFFNFNPLYGLIIAFNENIKTKVAIIINIIICFIILLNIFICFWKFSFYPSIFNYIFIFIELFLYFSNIIELVIYLTNSKIYSLKFNVIKLIVIFLNSFIFLLLFIYKKRESNLELFSYNLFNKTYKNLNPDDLYYYIEKYIQYSKNKTNNYLKIFRLIQRHTLTCNKKDCPGRLLIPKDMSYSIFTNFSNYKNEDNFQNSHRVQSQINNEEKPYKYETNIKKLSETIIKENNNKSNVEINNSDKSHRKRSLIESYKNLNKSLIGKESIKCNIKNEINDSIENISKETEEEISISNKIKNKKKKNSIIGNINDVNNLNNITNIGNISILNHNEINNDKIPYPNNERKWLKDEHFQMIGEQEIINRINFLYKHKINNIMETYIFIHLQYLIRIKQNFRLALYFLGKYCQSGIKYSFLSKYYFYEIKKFLCINLNSSKVKTKTKDPYIIKYKEENFFMKKFVKYINTYNMLKKLLKISCQKIIYFFTFRTELQNSLTLRKYINSKIYPVIHSAEETRSSIFKIKSLLEKYVKEEKHPFESIELSYLITNFFKLIEGKISPSNLKLITPILYFKDLYYEKLMKEFHIFMISHPLIISLTKKDTFNIIYCSNIIAEKLDYKYSDLINSDFHEKLFPGGQKLIKEHTILIKQFLFFNKNVYTKENTFLKSKDGYLVPINFICKTFPYFIDEFYLITNIIFNDEPISGLFYNTIEHNMKTSNFNNEDKMVNIYSFILNSDFDFFGSTKNFFIEYHLNRDMFRELRINFCQFFCVDENKLNEQIIKEKKRLLRKYPYLNNKITLKEINKAYTIFQNISIKNTFKIRQEKILENYFYSPIFIYDRIDKKKLIQKVPEIMNIIDEIGLDYEWNIKLQSFKDRLIHNCHFRDIKESVINVKDHERFLMELRNSTITDKNKIDGINYTKNPEQFFEVIYSIKKLGSLTYYLVYLHEKLNENNEKSQYDNENEENVSRRNSSVSNNNNPLKTITKKNFNKKNTISLKKKGESNLEFNFNKPKTKNKVSFPDITIQKSNISNEKNENIEENNKKESELNSKNIYDIDESKKDDNDFSQNLEVPRKIKINKNEYYEDEETAPLITKDKFNEKISKYKKRNKILIIIINALIILTLIILIIRFFLSMKGYKENKNVISASMYLEMLKIDIYVQAVLSLIYCVDENHNVSRISLIHEEATIKLNNIINHLKLFQNQISIILNNKETLGIFETIEERFLINFLANDWTISNLNVDILYEVRRLSYVLYSLTTSNDTCNLTLFYQYLEKGHKIYEEGYTKKANDMQKIAFYFFMNIFYNYQKTFDQLSNECLIALNNMWMNFQNIIMYLLIIIQVLTYIFIIFYIIKIKFDYSYYKILFLYYYNIENEQLKFQNQIFYLYKTILDFNSENINNFEEIKNNGYLLSNNDINKMFTNFSKKSNDNNDNNKEQKKKKKKKKNISKENKEKNKYYNKNNKDKGSMLNNSLNGSSFQFLNNSNKLSINNLENNNSYQSNLNEKEQNNNSQEESVDLLLKMIRKILPSSIKISLIFMIVNIFIYSSLNLGNIFEIFKENSIWKFSINLSMNIMERIPKLVVMVLYACMTVISNNKNFIQLSSFGDSQLNYLTYFELNSLYYSEDIMNRYLKDNFFGQLLKDNLRINYNLATYLHQEENNMFKVTRDMDKKLNKAGYFCIFAGIGDIMNNKEELENYEFIKKLESKTLNCITDSPSISDSGIELEINYILNEMTNKYIEFITYNSSNIDLEQARKNFFGSSDIKRIFGDIQYPFVMYYNSIMYTMNIDFDNQNKAIMKRQNLYTFFLFVINLAIIIFLVFSIKKDERYKEMFYYFSGIPKYNSG